MTAPAFDEVCPYCVAQNGLCAGDYCRNAVLPQLSKPSWVRLVGATLTEQTKRQTKIEKDLPVSPEAKAHKARVKSARSIARSRRKGYFGLAKAILNAKGA